MKLKNQPFILLFLSKEYRLFWIAALFSNIGMWALIYGRLWLMRTMTDSETMLGIVSSAVYTPVLLLSIFGGVLADKYNRLKIIRITRLMFCVITVLTAILIFLELMNPTILILLSIITGILLAIDIPSRSSMIARLVDKKFLAVGISMYSIIFGVSGIIGPSLFHPIVKGFGLEGLFLIIGISYLLTFITLKKMDPSVHLANNNNKSVLSDLLSGVRYLFKTPIIFVFILIGFFFGITAGSFDVLLPAVTTDLLNGNSETYGNLLLFGGISGLVSTSLLILFGQKINQYILYFFFGIILSVSLILLSTNFGIVYIFIIFSIISFSKVIFTTLGSTIIQSNVKEEFRGRIMSINQLTWGSVSLGVILVGYLAESISISFSFRFIGVTSFLIIFFGAILSFLFLFKRKR
jgi:MFS family permease|tara:strand:- start:930 stop:2153 length:1224 start_codon:yes stop_codon:yes gene_type:complete